jgi:sec-independent protein translocase protein TatB
MFGIGTGELLLIALVALLVLGPERMPRLMRDVGKTVNDLRKTSDQLRGDLLNADLTSADRMLDAASRAIAPPPPAATQVDVATAPIEPVDAPPPVQPIEPDETAFDKEARLARERMQDPEASRARDERAASEGWTIPTDDAGTSPREG